MKIFILILLFTIQSFALSGELLDIRKIAENKILIRFNDNVTYKSTFTLDKKNISLEIKNSISKLKNTNQLINSELIKEVFVQSKSSNLLLNIILKSSSGFNTYKLPYSNAIIVDVFDWSKLTKDEDNYRSGLFAYESNLYSQAIILFEESKESVKEARSMLGIVYLLEDSLKLSFNQLTIAARNDSYLPDVYAALSQIYNEKGSSTKAKYYEDKFKSKLGVKDSAFEYPKLIFNKSNIDSLEVTETLDSSKVDLEEVNTNNRFSNLFDKDNSKTTSISTQKNKLENEDAFQNLKGFLKYIIIAIILLGLMLIALYLKWRKTKLDAQNQIARSSFEKELQKVSKTVKNESGIIVDRTDMIDTKISEEKKKPIQKKERINFNEDSNIIIDNTDKKVEAKEILANIELIKNSDSNLNNSSKEMDNNKLKIKLYNKYNVDNKEK